MSKCHETCRLIVVFFVSQVNLEKNRFNDSDAFLFASALRQNKTLLCLDLNRNKITAKGRKILLRALFDITSLNALSDSNHTCLVKLLPDCKGTDVTILASPEMVQSVNNPKLRKLHGRKPKIHGMIFAPPDGLSSLRYFEKVPVECFPEVLDLIQYSFPGDFDRLQKHTLVYDLLRATPSIFVAQKATRKRKRQDTVNSLSTLTASVTLL